VSTRSSDARRVAPARGGQFVVAPGAVAPIVRRVLAYAVDVLLLLAAYLVGWAVAGAAGSDGAPAALLLLPSGLCLVVAVAQWLAESFTGASAGSALLGIRVVSVQTGRPAGPVAILVRQLVVGVSALACFVGQWVVVVSGVWDKTPSQRGWHDKLAGTLVLRTSYVPLAAGGVPAPASAWDTAVARAVGHPGGGYPEASGRAESGPVTSGPLPGPVTSGPLSGPVTSGPAAGSVESGPAAWPVAPGPVPLVPISHAPGVRPPTVPLPEAASPAPMIDVPADVRPQPGAPVLPPRVIGAPPAPAHDPAPGASATATPSPAELIQGPPPGSPSSAPPPQGSANAQPPLQEGQQASPLPGSSEQGTRSSGSPAVRSRRELRLDDDRAVDGPRDQRPPVPDLGDLEYTRLRPGGTAGPTSPAAPPVQAGLRLVFDTGERLDVVGDGLVGRSPAAEDGVEHVVAIDDPERSISKVHLAFGPTPDGDLWLMDRGSTNGTVLVGPDGSGAVLPAGTRVAVRAGSTIRFGQRSVRVERR